MSKRTINGMNKSELVTLIRGAVAKINKIDQSLEKTNSIDELYGQIKDKEQEINGLHSIIFGQNGQQSQINAFLESAEATDSDIDSARNKILNENDGFLKEIEYAHSQSLEKSRDIEGTYTRIQNNETNAINLVSSFDSQNEKINKVYDEIFNTEEGNGESGSLENIQNAQREAEEKLGSIQNFYKKTFEDTNEAISIQNKLDEFVSKFQKYSNEFTKLHNDIFGYIENNDDEKEVKHTGELNRTREVFKKYQEKYDVFFNQIEGLLSGCNYNKFI